MSNTRLCPVTATWVSNASRSATGTNTAANIASGRPARAAAITSSAPARSSPTTASFCASVGGTSTAHSGGSRSGSKIATARAAARAAHTHP